LVNRLKILYELQLIDDKLDQLEELRGDLPLAVNELTGRINEKKEVIDAKTKEKDEAVDKRKNNDNEIAKLNSDLKKYKAQLYKVRNNKEYDALTKEIDHSEESIEKFENENIALEELMEKLKIEINELTPALDELNDELKTKEEELKKIIKSNEKEEDKLKIERDKVAKKVKKPDYNSYMRIRKAKAGKGVVPILRSACSGCHNVVPPQRQIEIRQSKKMFNCESCGRILISQDIAEEVEKAYQAA
jgi:predicted  nucleic acid-binding Zn-ribbon protein